MIKKEESNLGNLRPQPIPNSMCSVDTLHSGADIPSTQSLEFDGPALSGGKEDAQKTVVCPECLGFSVTSSLGRHRFTEEKWL